MIFGAGKGDVAELKEQVAKLTEENKRLRAALEFYANPKHWSEGHKYRDPDEATIYQEDESSVQLDKGMVAQKALEESS